MNQQGEHFQEELSIESEHAMLSLVSIAQHIEEFEIQKYLREKTFLESNFLQIQKLTNEIISILKRFEHQVGFTKTQKLEGAITSLHEEEKNALSTIASVLKEQIIPFFESTIRFGVIPEESKKESEKEINYLEGIVKKCELYIVGIDDLE